MDQRKEKQIVFVSVNASRFGKSIFFSHVEVKRFLELSYIPLKNSLCYSSKLKECRFFFFLAITRCIYTKRVKSHLSYQHLLKTQSQQDHNTTKSFRTSAFRLQNTEETPDLNSISIFASLGKMGA